MAKGRGRTRRITRDLMAGMKWTSPKDRFVPDWDKAPAAEQQILRMEEIDEEVTRQTPRLGGVTRPGS